MSEHIRYARNRREFLDRVFLRRRFAGLRLDDGQEQAARRALQSARAQAAAHAGPRQGQSRHLRVHGGRPVATSKPSTPSRCSTSSTARSAPPNSATSSIRTSTPPRACSAPSAPSRSTASRASRCRTCFRTRPKSSTTSASSAPCTATWWSTPPRSIR